MFKNNCKIAWRGLSRQKMYSFIKIGGWALGIAASLLIALFIKDELSYDKYYEHAELIYRVVNEHREPGEVEKWPALPAPFAQVLKEGFPQIEKTGRIMPYKKANAGSNQMRPVGRLENTYEEGFIYADPEMLEILQIPMVYGSRDKALNDRNTIVISKRKAEKYYPGENPVGKIIVLNEDESNPFKIGGVMENFPANSHFQYDFLITLKGQEFWPGEQTSWDAWNYNTYVQLKPGTGPLELEQNLLSIRDDYIVRGLQKIGKEEASEVHKYHFFHLQPVSDIYLNPEGIQDRLNHGNIKTVWLFGAIAGFILLLACVNFINLSTAKSANRAREVGLRKVVGSNSGSLIWQFLTESLLFTSISLALGILLAWVLLPYFNLLSDKSMVFPWTEWWLVPLFILSVVTIGLLAGLYPAFYLSAFKPIEVLKGNVSRGSKNSSLRSSLVVFQFTTSIVLIIGALITDRQMGYILNKELGFDKEQVIVIQSTNTLGEQLLPFKNELLRLSGIKNVTVSSYLPVSGTKRDQNMFWREGKKQEYKPVGAQNWYVDHDYIETMGMRIVEGRDFSPEMASDSLAVIINETMARKLGHENPVGMRISRFWGGPDLHVIGIIEDFHFESVKGEITGLCMVLGNSNSTVAVKAGTEDITGLLGAITTVWDKFQPYQPFRYNFLDERFARMYEDVKRTSMVFSSLAALAVIVACLGLFALSAFMTEQRRKEISVRKVLGASLGSIFQLLTLSFVKLVLISLVIAVPIAWKMMQKWLEDFENRTDVNWDVFLLAGIIVISIAVITISYQSVRAALTDPVDNLRSE